MTQVTSAGQVLKLYREFLASEPCSVLLDLAACGLDTRPGILTSLSSLTAAGGVILCLEDGGRGALGNMIMSYLKLLVK